MIYYMDPLLYNLIPLHIRIQVVARDLKEKGLNKKRRSLLEKKRNAMIVRAMMIGDYIVNVN